MKIYNFGSINIDHFYALPHFPDPGETLHSQSYSESLGGKGANQSIAAARAGASVFHIGAIGKKDVQILDILRQAGVNCDHVTRMDAATGHAIIYVETGVSKENQIVLVSGANTENSFEAVEQALAGAVPGDILLLQNETNIVSQVAEFAQKKGMQVVYTAAPFDAAAVKAVLPFVSTLVMNKGESEQICAALDCELPDLDVSEIVVTLGSDGAYWRSNKTGEVVTVDGVKVEVKDTTAAGDTFLGYWAAGVSLGQTTREAMLWAADAAALKVTREGTADVIPTAAEVLSFKA